MHTSLPRMGNQITLAHDPAFLMRNPVVIFEVIIFLDKAGFDHALGYSAALRIV
ncbi:MAG: hypothetical protein JWS10_1812 [Cypionkella sp.]|nr:hypothetical protein [Cypionkella sp.]